MIKGVKTMKQYLNPQYTGNKSYYKKAIVYYDQTTNTYALQSYDTRVISYNATTNTLTKLWFGYSRTTMKHIIDFVRQYTNTPQSTRLNKKWWDNLSQETHTKYRIVARHAFGCNYSPNTIFDNEDDAYDYADKLNAQSNGLWYYDVEELK